MTESNGKGKKVVVALSGGVDSSVAACLLVERGYDVTGLFMRVGPETTTDPAGKSDTETPDTTHRGCCGVADAADARFVAGMLGIPFFALNFREDFDAIIEHFADEYVRGRTPNPCIICNNDLKFGKIIDYADAIGADFVATGHYARTDRRDGRTVLMRGLDQGKDQSYVLFGLQRAVLDRTIFPIGEYHKDQIRELAARFGLPNSDKPDSMEICFAPDGDYARVVRDRRPEGFIEGDVVDQSGRVIGRHRGIGHYTIGQRRGLGIAASRPIYVTDIDPKANIVTMGEKDDLLCPALVASRTSFLVDPPEEPFRAEVKIRYLHKAAPATVHPLEDGNIRVVFERPQSAVTPGQAAVLYDGDIVIGGGWIERAERT